TGVRAAHVAGRSGGADGPLGEGGGIAAEGRRRRALKRLPARGPWAGPGIALGRTRRTLPSHLPTVGGQDMRWQGGRESRNVEDRRGRGGLGFPGGGGMRRGGGIGIGTLLIALVVGWFLGINPFTLLGMLDGGGPVVQAPQPTPGSGSSGGPAQAG